MCPPCVLRYATLRYHGRNRAAAGVILASSLVGNAATLAFVYTVRTEVLVATAEWQGTPVSLALTTAYCLCIGAFVGAQPSSVRSRVGTFVVGLLLQGLVRIAVYVRTGNAAAVTWVLFCRSVGFSAGFVGVLRRAALMARRHVASHDGHAATNG